MSATTKDKLCLQCTSVATLFTDEGEFCSEPCLRAYREDYVSGALDAEAGDAND